MLGALYCNGAFDVCKRGKGLPLISLGDTRIWFNEGRGANELEVEAMADQSQDPIGRFGKRDGHRIVEG